MMRGERENFFSREKKPNVGFVILPPLSRHSLGDGGSLPFKKSGELFYLPLPTNVGNRAFFKQSNCYLSTRAPPPCMSFFTSGQVAMEVSPGVVIARAP